MHARALHPAQLIEQTRNFISKSDKFLCGFGRYALANDRLNLVCLPSFRLQGAGLDRNLAGEPALIANPELLQSGIREAFRTYKSKDQEGIVFIDPYNSRDHSSAYNRTWSFYVELALACLKMIGPRTVEDIRIANQPDTLSRKRLQNLTANFTTPVNSEFYKDDGQLDDGNSNLHYFALNSLYSENHPRYAPVSLLVVTNLRKVAKAKDSMGSDGRVIGRKIIAAMYQEQVRRGLRPYDGDLPYVIPGDSRFDPILLTTIIKETSSLAASRGITAKAAELACSRLYYQLNADHPGDYTLTSPEQIQAGFLQMLETPVS